jgi:hypothetical protein
LKRFIVDVNSGTFYWAEAGEAEDDDDDDGEEVGQVEEPYVSGGGAPPAAQSLIKSISVDEVNKERESQYSNTQISFLYFNVNRILFCLCQHHKHTSFFSLSIFLNDDHMIIYM